MVIICFAVNGVRRMDKEWLFKENIRLDKLKQELEEQRQTLKREQDRLAGERRDFEQQKKVLEIGFQKLAADKEMFQAAVKKQNEKERRAQKNKEARENCRYSDSLKGFRGPGFFGGVTGYSSLKKRYKDLMKIFHPDNKGGDSFTVACINKEFEILKSGYKSKE